MFPPSIIVARHSTSFTRTWHRATLGLAQGVFQPLLSSFSFFFFNTTPDLLLKYLRTWHAGQDWSHRWEPYFIQ